MVRCGCTNNECFCVVTAGSGITVTGTGASGNPYVVTAVPVAPPHCAVRHNVNQVHTTNSAWQALVFDTEDEDAFSMHDTVANTSRITIPAGGAGLYVISGFCLFQADADGLRAVGFRKNSSGANAANVKGRLQASITGGGNDEGLSASTVIKLAVGDYIEFVAFQNSGGANNLLSNPAEHYPYFTATWLGIG